MLKLFTDDDIAEQTPFHQVQAQAFSILQRDKLDFIADHITTKARFDETAFQWEHIDTLARQFKRHLRPILLAVDFAASKAQSPLIEAVAFLKEVFQKGKSLGQYSVFPIRFIPNKTKRYLYRHNNQGQKHLLVDRYEFLVYRFLRNGLEAGDIFCRDSVRFRSFEDDLIDDQRWQQREQLIADTGLTVLKQPIQEHLKSLEQRLEERIIAVNQRIASGENEHFQITKRGKQSSWTLQYPRASEAVNHPFFENLRQVDISDVMHFVNQQCQFMEAFDRKPKASVSAANISWGVTSNQSGMTMPLLLPLLPGRPTHHFLRWQKFQISNTTSLLLFQLISFVWKLSQKRMTASATISQSYLYFSITISEKQFTPVVTDKNSKPKYIPSMRVIHENILA